VRIQSRRSPWNGKIGRVVEFTTARVKTILESANPHLEPQSRYFLDSNLQRMDDNENPSIANELRNQFEWSQQKVRVKNPEHVLAEHVLVNYDTRFLYNVVRVPTGMEPLSVYKTPALSRRNELVSARNVWVPNWLARAHDKQRERDQEADPEMEAINVPSEVRMANDCGQSASVGSTTFYLACSEDHNNTTIGTNLETTRNQSRLHTVTPPADHHPSDGTFRAEATIDRAVLSAIKVILDHITANKGQINGNTLEQLFNHIQ
jgi:hypothetical protein